MTGWIISTSDIKHGGSAILGGNKFAFYSIHYTGILNISISMISCVAVILHILLNFIKSRARVTENERNKFDFSQRFPLYLAVADFLWGLSYFAEHLYVITTEKYPTGWTITLFSGNMYFFLGYQQLMHAGLAIYIYLRVVRLKTLDLGTGEWRLQLFCFSLLGFSTIFFHFKGSYGCSGYWCLANGTSTGGIWLRYWVAILFTLNAVCTTWGYHLISVKVKEQIEERKHRAQTSSGQMESASECLATFVRNAIIFYCPLALFSWVFNTLILLGFIEPISAFIIVNIANSGGWANAWGFFHNERLKRRARTDTGSLNPSVAL